MALLERRCYGLRKNRLRGGSGQEKAQYGAPSAPEVAPFKGRAEGNPLHPPLKGQSEGRGAYFVRSFDVSAWFIFQVILVLS